MNYSQKERKNMFLLDFQLAWTDWDTKSCSKVGQGHTRGPASDLRRPLSLSYTLGWVCHRSSTNNAFANGTSEQRQAIERIITTDTTRKAAGGEQCGGTTMRAIPSRCRDGPRMGVRLRWQRRKLHPIIPQATSQMFSGSVTVDCKYQLRFCKNGQK